MPSAAAAVAAAVSAITHVTATCYTVTLVSDNTASEFRFINKFKMLLKVTRES